MIDKKLIKEIKKALGDNVTGWSNQVHQNVVIVYVKEDVPYAPTALYVNNTKYEIKLVKLGKVKAL